MRTAPVSSLAVAVLATAAVVCTPPLVHGQNAPSPMPSGSTSARPGLPGTPPRDSSARGPATVVGTAVVRGRVIAGDTGLPLRRARVTLQPLAGGEPRVTLGDADGGFAFEALPAGRYEL